MFAQTLLLNENFDYGSSANSDLTAVGTTWARHSGAQGPTYVATSLTLAGYPASAVGGSLGFTFGSSGNNDGDANKSFTAQNTTSNVYVSFLLNLSAAKGTADYFFHLGPAVIGTSFRGRVFAIANGAGWNIGLAKMSGTATMNTTTILDFNKTYLIVIKYAFNSTSASDDACSLFVYDSLPASEAAASLVSILNVNDGASDPTDIGCVAVRQSSNCPTGTIDGIRASTNWGVTVTGTPTGVEKENSTIPNQFSLDQNYPNPFNPATQISFSVPSAGNYSLKVYDVLGKEVETLVNQELSAGKYKVNFNASKLASGTYIYRLTGNNVNLAQKMMLVK
jgi:hypothetical protein